MGRGNSPVVKKNLYFPSELLDEIQHEARRLDRSVTWLLIHAWMLARNDICEFPNYPLRETRRVGTAPAEEPAREHA
jgi:uncharacterized small protein (TIGR04563 family)